MEENKKKQAWVVLVMIGDKYVPGALVLAESILETNSKHDLICMITDDVSYKARSVLQQLYTKLIVVPYIKMDNIPRFSTAKQRKWYGRWINRSFTKWNIFSESLFGEQYNKVILLDADMVFIKNCDELFDMEPVAMTFSTPWAVPYCNNGGIPNYYLKPTELQHGELVSIETLRSARVDGFVGRGSVVLVKPDNKIYEKITELVGQGLKSSNCASGFDEQILADALLELGIQPRNIHQKYNWVVGKQSWLIPPCSAATGWRSVSTVPKPTTEPYVYQWYGIPKPWAMEKDSWPDLKVWWNIARNVVRFHNDSRDFLNCDAK